MNIPFLGHWLERQDRARLAELAEAVAGDPESPNELLSECELLRDQAGAVGVELDDTPESLTALDQLLPRWRDDPDITPWLGSDAGLYLGTVIVRTVPGAGWRLWEDGQPVVRLPSGRELDVLEQGVSWAETGAPELSQLYAEAAER